MNGIKRLGFRGYISSRHVRGSIVPQKIQNLVIRDYCKRNSLHYLLSSTEYVMSGCYMMLNDVLEELHHLEGIVAFSIFMLPKKSERRFALYETILHGGYELHCAMEEMCLKQDSDVSDFENLLGVAKALSTTSPVTDISQLVRQFQN